MQEKTYTILLILFLGIPPFLSLAQPVIEWEKNYGGTGDDRAESIQQTPDGGYILTGYSPSSDFDVSSNNGGNDFWLVKIDDIGTIQWENNYGGSGLDEAREVRLTTDGGYVVVGSSPSSDGDVGNNYGDYDYWVIKTDAVGLLEWERNLGGPENDRGWSTQQTADGGYIVVGHSSSEAGDVNANYGANDYWLAKLDANGTFLWGNNFGGSSLDRVRSLQLTTDGGYIIGGYSKSNDFDLGGNNGNDDFWVVKTNDMGVLQWETNLGGSSDEAVRAIQQTSDGGYIVGGSAFSNDGDVGDNKGGKDFWAVKLNDAGNMEWEQNYGGSGDDIIRALQQTNDGGFIFAGVTSSTDEDVSVSKGGNDYWLVKTNALGAMEWELSLGGTGHEVARSVLETADGEYILAGYTISTDGDISNNNGTYDFWVVKLITCDVEEIFSSALSQCEDNVGLGSATFDLTSADMTINNGTGNVVTWYTDANAMTPIINPSQFAATDGTSVYAQMGTAPCFSNIAEVILTVNAYPFVSGPSGEVNVCQSSIETYQTSSSLPDVTYTWILPSGASVIGPDNEASVTINWGFSDGGLLGVNASNDCGTGISIYVTITVADISTSTGEDSGSACPNESYIYPGDGLPYPPGIHNIIFTNSAANGCDSMVILNVAQLGSPDTTVVTTSICEGDPPVIIAGQSFDQTGIYMVEGLTTDFGCDSLLMLDLTVISFNDLDNADAGSNQIICDTFFTLSGNLPPTTGGLWASLDGATINSPDQNNTQVNNLQIGNNIFTWTLTHDDCGTYDSDTVTLTVHTVPLSPSISGEVNICQLTSETYQAGIVADATNYQWILPVGATAIGPDDEASINIDWGLSTGGLLCVSAVNDCGPGPNNCLMVNLNSVSSGEDYGSSCLGDTYIYPGDGMPYAPGVHNIFFPNGASNGCDSIVTLTVFGLSESQINIDTILCESDPPIVINGQIFEQAGNFTIGGMTNYLGCDSTVVLNLQVVSFNQLELADAGTDAIICDSVFSLSGNIPVNANGIWSSIDEATIANSSQPNTQISGLQFGNNIFAWTLTHIVCGIYDSDTVVITQTNMPIANDDAFTSDYESPGNVFFNILDNDHFEAITDFTYEILNNPEGDLLDLGNGQFSYNAPSALLGSSISFNYILCNQQCISGCDTAQVVITLVESNFPNTITPNGDGINDVFIIPDLESDPSQFATRQLIIFNRWGDIIFQAKPYNNDWGGTNESGDELPQGTYYYVLRVDIGEGIIYRGDITVLK